MQEYDNDNTFVDWDFGVLPTDDTAEDVVSGCEEQNFNWGYFTRDIGEHYTGPDFHIKSHESSHAVQKGTGTS